MSENTDFVVATVQGDDMQRYLRWHPDKPAFGYSIGAEVMLVSDHERELKAVWKDLAYLEDEFDTLEHSNISLKMALHSAEQRNAELEAELRNIRQTCELSKIRDARIDKLLAKPTESGSSE